jgi:hypothetical protein
MHRVERVLSSLTQQLLQGSQIGRCLRVYACLTTSFHLFDPITLATIMSRQQLSTVSIFCWERYTGSTPLISLGSLFSDYSRPLQL